MSTYEEDEDVNLPSEEDGDELYEHHRFQVDPGQELLRIDKYLLHKLTVSRNRIQKAADAGAVRVNENPVKSNYKVKPNDVISIVFAHPKTEFTLKPEKIPLNIVFEDEHLIVVNKQAGLVVHPGHGNYSGTLVNGLLYYLHELPDSQSSYTGPEDELRPGLVHRIDKDTSGLMVIAKNETTMTHLARQFFDRTIDRKYMALVWGDVSDETGRIEGNIGRDKKDRKLMHVYADGDEGKHAVTNYTVLERFGYVSLVECKLETGRTHQIRIHMKYIGHPLFNDPFYGGDRVVKGVDSAKYRQLVQNCFDLIPGQALHARSLGFIHPQSGKEMYFEAPPPEGFEEVLLKWKNYVHHTLKL